MKNNLFLFGMLAIVMLACNAPNEKIDEPIIGKPEITMKSDRLTPEVLWSLGRIGELAVSPDKTQIVYSVKYYDISENAGNSDLYLMNIDGTDLKQITRTAKSEFSIQWRPDGKKIGFVYPSNKGTQLWEMNPDGTGRVQISSIDGGINGFKYSPDQTKIVFIKEVDLVDQVKDVHPDLPNANAHLTDDLMFRHWDTWTNSFSHAFIGEYDGKSVQNIVDILEGEKYDVPNKPFGGMEQLNWSPDSKSLVYACVKKFGLEYSISTNADIYQYQLLTGETKNLSQGMMGYDVAPVFSPDGKWLAWESMERDGYESDQNRLFILNLESDEKKDYTIGFDQNVHGLEWNDKSDKIFFYSDWHACYQAYELDVTTEKIVALSQGVHNITGVHFAGDRLIIKKMSMSLPTELFSIDLSTKKETQISTINTEIWGKLNLGKVEKRWVKTTDDKQMLVWVILPPNFDPTKKYPTLLYCQGGPQSSVSQFFSYRWNFQIMAANDYIIVAPNRRGLPSFGKEWNEQISGDYGGQNMKDYFSAIDALAQEPYVDEDRLGAVGASYGGFSVFWIAGNHNKRFKAFISHDGLFNLESQYLETEEMWFVNWDLGGPFWEKDNEVVQKSYANSPHKFVQNWDTPIMVIHGEKDYRVVYTQGMQAFTAAKLRGIPARYLHFPEENHWVLSPQNGVLWQREFFKWLDKWLKD